MARIPLNVDYMKVNIHGTINGAQSWSTGVWCDAAGAGNASSTDCQAMAQVLSASVSSCWLNFRAFCTASTLLTGVSVYAYAGGSLTSRANGNYAYATPTAGTATTGTSALTALCCSLLTAGSGASSRGRMYWPATGMTTDATTLNWTSAQCTTASTALAAMLTSFQQATQTIITNCVPVVMSFTRGTSAPINVVSVNSMPDTQHRREDKLTPSFRVSHAV